jgi:hypothetical protein
MAKSPRKDPGKFFPSCRTCPIGTPCPKPKLPVKVIGTGAAVAVKPEYTLLPGGPNWDQSTVSLPVLALGHTMVLPAEALDKVTSTNAASSVVIFISSFLHFFDPIASPREQNFKDEICQVPTHSFGLE